MGPTSPSVRSTTASMSASTVTSAVIGVATSPDCGRRGHRAVGVAVDDHDRPRPLGREPEAQGPTDAAGAAGHDADAITKLHGADRTHAH